MNDSENLFLYHLRLTPAYQNPDTWTEKDHQVIQKHAQFLDYLGQKGILGLAGRTQYDFDHPDLFGIAIIRAADLESARKIMQGDPAVQAGIQTASLHPYSIAINHINNLVSNQESSETFTEDEMQVIAAQLGKPEGEIGLQIGERLNKNNRSMILRGINSLLLQDGEQVLELGHATCGHLPDLMAQAENLIFTGLEISELMVQEAKFKNAQWLAERRAAFHHYDGMNIPFPRSSFDKVLSVNTLYFWGDVPKLLTEIYRVLRPGGHCSLVFGTPDFLKSLPVTQYGFSFYGPKEIADLMKQIPFERSETLEFSDAYFNEITQQTETRDYYIWTLRK